MQSVIRFPNDIRILIAKSSGLAKHALPIAHNVMRRRAIDGTCIGSAWLGECREVSVAKARKDTARFAILGFLSSGAKDIATKVESSSCQA
jgi:hypothetical protein